MLFPYALLWVTIFHWILTDNWYLVNSWDATWAIQEVYKDSELHISPGLFTNNEQEDAHCDLTDIAVVPYKKRKVAAWWPSNDKMASTYYANIHRQIHLLAVIIPQIIVKYL